MFSTFFIFVKAVDLSGLRTTVLYKSHIVIVQVLDLCDLAQSFLVILYVYKYSIGKKIVMGVPWMPYMSMSGCGGQKQVERGRQ